MYDELIKRQREKAGAFDYDGRPDIACDYEQAADAIENMREMVATAHCELANVIQSHEESKPRWIPVTERLPETSGTYLAWMQWDLTDPDDNPSAYPIEYDAEEEAFGWWRSYFDPESLGWAGEEFIRYEGVTHWMPLPEPPKEDAE